MKHLNVGGFVIMAVLSMTASSAWAETTTTICVPTTAGKTVVSGAGGVCKNTKSITYSAVDLPGPSGLETLNAVLAHMKYEEKGIAGKPTIQFSGVNVQVVNGEGKTASVNGAGNIVIGYDENEGKHSQTGSNNLILGEEQTFTSFGGLVAGFGNTISNREASVSGGAENTAGGFYTSISGGERNVASVEGASVSGGVQNTASKPWASVSAGKENTASGHEAWVGGGFKNHAEGAFSSIFGGKELTAKNEFAALP